MTLGVLKVGVLTLNENYTIVDATNAQSGVRTVNISGIETYPGRSLEQVRALADDLTAMYGKTVPVTFSHKTDRNGYYTIEDVNTSAVHWDGHASGFTWSLGLTRIGPDNAVDIESRLTYVVRANDFAKVGERWHAPPIGHQGYFIGNVVPATVVRAGADGPITVYRAIPAAIPRWASPAETFLSGRVKLLDDNGIERAGHRIKLPPLGWELNNGLVRVKPNPSSAAFTTLLVAHWDGSAWREKAFDVRVAGDSLRPAVDWQAMTVLRLDPEVITIRVMAKQPSNGSRCLLDLTMRRGSRIVEGYVQRTVSGEISVMLDVAEWTTNSTGYVVAGGEDANGLRFTVGSARSYTSSAGGIIKSSTTALDFYIGAEVPRASVGGTNPGFETGVAGPPWYPFNGTLTIRSDTPKHGTYYGRITATAAGTNLALDHTHAETVATAGKQYTITGWIRSPVAVAAGQSRVTLQWRDIAGATLSTTSFVAPALVADVWTPVSGTATAPANTTAIGRQAQIDAVAVSVGSILDVDSLQVREAIDSGDAAAALYDQYIAAGSEATMVVAR